jgi:hypothetical protein
LTLKYIKFQRTWWWLFWAYLMMVILSVPDDGYFERTWWWLFRKHVVRFFWSFFCLFVFFLVCFFFFIKFLEFEDHSVVDVLVRESNRYVDLHWNRYLVIKT